MCGKKFFKTGPLFMAQDLALFVALGLVCLGLVVSLKELALALPSYLVMHLQSLQKIMAFLPYD